MILDQFKLTGKVALVTGASTSLGQGVCGGLAEAGADIIGVDYGDLSETKALVERTGRKFLAISANLISIEPIQGIINRAQQVFGKIDILINNATTTRKSAALELTERDWDEEMNYNVKTVFFFSQAVARQFIRQNSGGKIINVASLFSLNNGLRISSYNASKSSIVGITKLMATEWARYNINVNMVAPGYLAADQPGDDNSRNADIIEKIPIGRWGTPEDLQGAVLYLASPAANYVTGSILAVDGGWLAR